MHFVRKRSAPNQRFGLPASTSEDRSRLIYPTGTTHFVWSRQVQLPLCDTPMYLLIISVGRIELPFSASKTGVLPLDETEVLVPPAGVEPATPCSSGITVFLGADCFFPRRGIIKTGGRPDKMLCLHLDRTCAYVTKYIHFGMIKWVGTSCAFLAVD